MSQCETDLSILLAIGNVIGEMNKDIFSFSFYQQQFQSSVRLTNSKPNLLKERQK